MATNVAWKSRAGLYPQMIGSSICRSSPQEAFSERLPRSTTKSSGMWDFLFVADKGVIRRKQEEAQTNQAGCLNLITNAVVIWNTVYMQAVLDQIRAEHGAVQEDDLAHLSPARFEHLNPYGKYYFPIDKTAE